MEKKKTDFIVLGYKAGIILSFLGIIGSALYLFSFLNLTSQVPTTEIALLSHTAEKRLLLLSTAIFVAMSFGFLGFALFLIQAKGETDAEVNIKDYKLKFARLSPGLFVILCATVIIVVCATFPINYNMQQGGASAEPAPHFSEEDDNIDIDMTDSTHISSDSSIVP